MPVPLVILVLTVVGLAVVAQTIPLSVTAEPPSAETFPPNVALTAPTPDAAVVVTVGALDVITVKMGLTPENVVPPASIS